MLIDCTDLPLHFQEVFEKLENVKKEIQDLASILLLEGELKPLPNTPMGETYPYNYCHYMEDSLDPDVQALSSLLNKVNETITTIKENNKR